MKRPTRPRPLSQRTLPSGLPRTVRDRGALALRAAPRLRGIASLAVTPDLSRDIPLPAPFIPDIVVPPLPVATKPVAAATTPVHDAMTLRGDFWDISYQQRKGVVSDSRGLRYIALLVRDTSGGREPIHAKELSAMGSGERPAAIELDADDAVLDNKAKKQLLKRLEDLASERDRAAAVEDFALAQKLDDEYERIADELSRSGGTRGNSRKKAAFVHAGEKARKAVAKAIAEAIAKIAAHPDLSPLAEHLTANVRKGQWLSYRGSNNWQISFNTPPPRK